jgi:predicted  nucleic acid-binding Zn-ribbon protein
VLARLPLARDHDFAQHARDAAANYQRSVQRRLNTLRDEFNASTAQIKAAAGGVEKSRASVSAEIAELAAGFERKLTEFERTLVTERAAIEQARTSQAQDYRDAQAQRDTDFKAALDAAHDEMGQLITESANEVHERVEEIRRMERESSALVGAIGLAGTAERYREEVEEQRGAANPGSTVRVTIGPVGG